MISSFNHVRSRRSVIATRCQAALSSRPACPWPTVVKITAAGFDARCPQMNLKDDHVGPCDHRREWLSLNFKLASDLRDWELMQISIVYTLVRSRLYLITLALLSHLLCLPSTACDMASRTNMSSSSPLRRSQPWELLADLQFTMVSLYSVQVIVSTVVFRFRIDDHGTKWTTFACESLTRPPRQALGLLLTLGTPVFSF